MPWQAQRSLSSATAMSARKPRLLARRFRSGAAAAKLSSSPGSKPSSLSAAIRSPSSIESSSSQGITRGTSGGLSGIAGFDPLDQRARRSARLRVRIARGHRAQAGQRRREVDSEQLAHRVPADEEILVVEETGDRGEGLRRLELAQERGQHLDSRGPVAIGAAADIKAGRGIELDADRRLIEHDLGLEDEQAGAGVLDDIALPPAIDNQDVAVREPPLPGADAGSGARSAEIGADLGRFPERDACIAGVEEFEHA